jgi:16S rRNA (guanine527-N7)-methyltransferase
VTTVSDLASVFGLSPSQEDALVRYVDLLLGWRLGNVTAVRTREEAVERLLGDSLALLDVPALATAGDRWLDLGAGAGIPGIPLAVARPATRLTLLDSVRKKCAFVEAAVNTTGLGARAGVVCARSEAFAAPTGGGREAFDVVVARAVASLAAVVELAAPLLAEGGVLLAVKTAAGAAAEGPAGEAAAARCGLSPGTVTSLTRSPLEGSVCVAYGKRALAPDWLPRRPGLATRHPLVP